MPALLRVQKKDRTRQEIKEAAMKLFRKNGFSATTVDEIADAARVGRRTFFRYFPTKEDLFFHTQALEAAIAQRRRLARGAGEDDVAYVMRMLSAVMAHQLEGIRAEHLLDFHRLTHEEPLLQARSWMLIERIRDALAEHLVGQHASQAEKLRARLLAVSCVMVVDVGNSLWIHSGRKGSPERLYARGAELIRQGFAGHLKISRK